MKKIVAMVTMLFLCTLLSGCACKHTFESVVVRNASCAECGIIRYTCTKCNAQYDDYVPQSGDHKYSAKEILSATCSTQGFKIYKCSTCGKTYSEKTPTNASHTYVVDSIKEATCTTSGTKSYKCTGCNAKKTETIPATGHVFSDATCTAPKTCKNCGKTEGNALGHITGGNTCPRCGASLFNKQSVINTIRAHYANGVNELSNSANYYKKAWDTSGITSDNYVREARDAMARASTHFQNAANTCGNYPEFASVKSELWSIIQVANDTVGKAGDPSSSQAFFAINSGLNNISPRLTNITNMINGLR